MDNKTFTNRLDKIVASKYKLSRNKALELIKTNKVSVNNKVITKPSCLISKNDLITLNEQNFYISRAALKLQKAIDYFHISINNKYCLDIGCSTGGFCQVLLNNNAKFIYAIDAGKNQFNSLLAKNIKIKLCEQTHFLKMKENDFKHHIDIVTCDVSFISSTKIIAHVNKILPCPYMMILLIKPQFELNAKIVHAKKGFVDPKYHKQAINNVLIVAKQNGFLCSKVIKSPIVGAKKHNIEYLVLLEKENKYEEKKK